MDWTPVFTAAVSAGSGLGGALIGYTSTQRAARGTRASDQRKRAVDRVVVALSALEAAYANYARQNGRERASELSLAERGFDRAVGLVDHRIIRLHCNRFGANLRTFYLYIEQADLDALDAGVSVPSSEQLQTQHANLIDELRRYESIRK